MVKLLNILLDLIVQYFSTEIQRYLQEVKEKSENLTFNRIFSPHSFPYNSQTSFYNLRVLGKCWLLNKKVTSGNLLLYDLSNLQNNHFVPIGCNNSQPPEKKSCEVFQLLVRSMWKISCVKDSTEVQLEDPYELSTYNLSTLVSTYSTSEAHHVLDQIMGNGKYHLLVHSFWNNSLILGH